MDFTAPQPLAITGIACTLPGALGLKEYWAMTLAGTYCVAKVPLERFEQPLYFDTKKGVTGKSFTNIAALVDHERFQTEILPDFLKQLKTENVGPQDVPNNLGHQISLYTAFEALRCAGYSPVDGRAKKMGAFLGLVSATDHGAYRTVAERCPCFLEKIRDIPEFRELSAQETTQITEEYSGKIQKDYRKWTETCQRVSPQDVALDIVRCFRFQGPGIGLDAACSSSLMSMALAGNYLYAGKLDAAIVGGVSYFSFGGLIHYSNAKAASINGSCPFDEKADGFVPGEGCAYAVLKTLPKAIADGDNILGIIRGLGISSDGKGKGLWAPRKEGQELAIRRAYQNGADMRNVDYVESHATSTTLGDATELAAMQSAFYEASPAKIYLTSHKANIGHVFEAAGMAGVIKVLLAMQHEMIPPQINFQQATSEFDWKQSPFVVPTAPVAWPKSETKPRTAAVDAFGIGGLNVHVVLEENNQAAKTLAQNVKTSNTSPIAIVGMGCVLPGAFSCAGFDELSKSGKDAKTPLPLNRNDLLLTQPELQTLKQLRGGFVQGYEYDWKRHKIPPNQIAKANPLQFMVLGAVDEAIENAGILSNLDKTRTAVVVGTRSDSDFLTVLNAMLFMPELKDRLEKTLKNHCTDASTIAKQSEAFVKHLYKEYPALSDETGGFTISTLASRVTKAYDFMGGAVAIEGGLCGSMAALENAMLLLQKGDVDTVVCVSGHRSMGYWRLRELQEQQKLNGLHELPESEIAPGEGACALVLRRLDDARRDENKICGILHDVTSVSNTENIQAAKDQAVRTAHENAGIAVSDIHISGLRDAVIRQMGHLGPVTGMATLIRTIFELERETTNSTKEGRVFGSVTDIDPTGVAYHVILERGQQIEAKKQVMQKMEPNDCVRKAETTSKPFDPESAASLPSAGRCWPDFYATCNKQQASLRKTAFLFPGQGSQKGGMLQKLATECPTFAERAAKLDAILERLQLPTFTDMVWENGQLLGKDVLRTQLSLLAAETLLMSLFEDLGFAPDIVFGHSYGEYPALVASGAWSFETAAIATTKRCEAIVQSAGCGTGMLSTNADEQTLQRLFVQINGELYISNRNAPDQTIVSGCSEHLKLLETALKKEKCASIILSVPGAFHSPLVKGVCEPLRAALREIEFKTPHHPFLSSVTTRFEADPDSIRENLVAQMVEPVNFVEMVKKAYKNGCRVFVEVGPKKVLTNLAKKILAGKDDVVFFACDDGKETSMAVLQEVRDYLTKHQLAVPGVRNIQWEQRDWEQDNNDENKKGKSETEKENIETAKKETEKEKLNSVDAVIGASEKFLLPEGLRFFELAGTPHEMGFDYGKQDAVRIRQMLRRYADVALQPGNMLPDTSDDVKNRLNRLFTPDDIEELRGIGEGAQVPFDALLRHNLSVFPEADTVAQQNLTAALSKRSIAGTGGCVQFAGVTADDTFVHAGNLDLPLARMLPGAVAPTLICKRQPGKLAYCSLGIVGRIGSIGGINERGICVSSCTLLDVPRTEKTTCGPLHASVVPKVLAEASTLDEAVEVVCQSAGTGGWTMIISELSTGKMAHIEYSGHQVYVNRELHHFSQANHSELIKPDGAKVPAHSINRKKRLLELLCVGNDGRFGVDTKNVFRILRDQFDIERGDVPAHRTMNTVCRIDNAFSWLVDAKNQLLYLTVTNKPDTTEHESNWKIIPIADLFKTPCAKSHDIKSHDIEPYEIKLHDDSKKLPVAASVSVESLKTIDYETFLKRNTAIDGRSPLRMRETVTERFANRMVEAALPEYSGVSKFPGAVLIVGGAENKVADLLESRIRQANAKIFRVAGDIDESTIEKTIGRFWNETPFYTVFLLGSYDKKLTKDADTFCWNRQTEQKVITAALLCKHWYAKLSQAKQLDQLELIAASRLGGDFGLSSHIDAIEGAGENGIVKAIFIEAIANYSTKTHAKTVDQSEGDSYETIVENLLREHAHCDMALEVGYHGNRRFLCRMVPTCVGMTPGNTLSEIEICKNLDVVNWVDDINSPSNFRSNSLLTESLSTNGKKPVWLVTGGARGICAEIAYALGKRFNAKLYLLGSSPIPKIEPLWRALDAEGLKQLKASVVKEAMAQKELPIAAWGRVEKAIEIDRFFQKLDAEKIEYEYFSCDVSNTDAVQSVIGKILAKDGTPDGFVHGAGYEKSTRIEKKTVEDIRRTIQIKVSGLVNILRAMGRMLPKRIVGMGSISGRFGATGQLDYVMANSLLAKVLADCVKRNPQTSATTINWTVWDDLGMGARPETRMPLKALGLGFLPPEEGKKHILSEIENGLQELEITILDWKYYKIFLPDETCRIQQPVNQQPINQQPISQQPVNAETQKNVSATNDCRRWWEVDRESFCKLNLSVHDLPPVVVPGDAAMRFVLRMLQSDLTSHDFDAFRPDGTVLLIGKNKVVDQMQKRLAERNINVLLLPAEIGQSELPDYLQNVWNNRPIHHLFCLNSYDAWAESQTSDSLEKRVHDKTILPIMVCRQMILMARESGCLDQLTFSVAGRFGGTFGLTGEVAVPDGGALAGFFKAASDELRIRDKMFVPLKIVDHKEETPIELIVDHLLQETTVDFLARLENDFRDPEKLLSTTSLQGKWCPFDMEVGYREGKRFVTRSVPLPLTKDILSLTKGVGQTPSEAEKTVAALTPLANRFAVTTNGSDYCGSQCDSFVSQNSFVSQGGTWIAVGGLRGITNACVTGLAQKYRPRKIILVGSSPYQMLSANFLDNASPDVAQKKQQVISECIKNRQNFSKVWSKFTRNQEMTRNFNRFNEIGIEIEYHVCDMRLRDDVIKLITLLETRGDRITGVINGAVLDDTDKSLENFQIEPLVAGIIVKVLGNTLFLEHLKNHPLEFYTGFGSVSGRFGGNGQTGYTASNDYLVKLLAHYQGHYPKCRFACFEWGAWSDVGIAWRPNVRGNLIMAKAIFISPEEGTRHFVDEFENGLVEPEPLFVAWKYYKRFQPDAINSLPREKKAVAFSHIFESHVFGNDVFGNNADARKIRQLFEEKNITDCLVVANGRDLEGMSVVPEAKRQRWFDEIVSPTLSSVETFLDQLSPEKTCHIFVLTSIDEIPAGRQIIEKMSEVKKKLELEKKSVQFEFLDLSLSMSSCEVAQKIETLRAQGCHVEPQKNAASLPVLIEEILERTTNRVAFRTTVDPKNDTFLIEHQVKNRPIMPAVLAMELMADASTLTTESAPLKAIRNVKIIRGMRCTVDVPYHLTVTAEKIASENGQSVWKSTITGDYYNNKDILINEKAPYFSCELVFDSREQKKIEIPPPGKNRFEIVYPEFGTFPIYHGEPLRGLKRVCFDDHKILTGKINCISQKALFRSRWNDQCSTDQSTLLNPSLIDACLYASGVLHGIGNANTSILPDYFAEFEIGTAKAAPGEPCTVIVELKDDVKLPMGYRNVIFDFVLCVASGEVIYKVKGFRATEVVVHRGRDGR